MALGVRGEIESLDAGRGVGPGPGLATRLRRRTGGQGHRRCSRPRDREHGDLAPDVAAALEDEPAAGEFFDALAQFYRRAYLRWIDGTKRRPEVRQERIAEMVEFLKAGRKTNR